MVTICIGPVCVPLHLLLPFLVGVLHRYGFFKWFKQEWVTLRFWRAWWAGSSQKTAEVKAKPDIAKADEAVRDATQQEKTPSSPASAQNTSTTSQQQRNGIKGNDTQRHTLQSDLGRSAGLQQRTPGQDDFNTVPAS